MKVLEWRQKNRASIIEIVLHFDNSNVGTISGWQKKFEDIMNEVYTVVNQYYLLVTN